jgi:hypothetical protein
MLKELGLLIVGAAGMFLTANRSLGATIVVPNSLANVEGNTGNYSPFGASRTADSDERYQQIYDASEFPASELLISEIRFRPNSTPEGGSAFSGTLADVQISFSTTSRNLVDGLSRTFAENVGLDATVIHTGPLSLSSAFTGNFPKDFDIVIPFTTPFFFNPAAGNLLLDVRVNSFGPQWPENFFADAEFGPGNGDTRIDTILLGVDLPTAPYGDAMRLITQFTFTTVPEPSSVVLGALGSALCIAFGLKRRAPAPVALR